MSAVLARLLKNCTLCPRRCGVNRTAGQRGACGLGAAPVVSHALAHYGEEPPISGTGGTGTIFFASCNLHCRFCQNYQISHTGQGRATTIAALADIMLALQAQGCHTIDAVTPTPQAAALAAACLLARERGLRLPLVYNCGGYELPEVIRLLAGIVDVYLPDFKYGLTAEGLALAGVPDYPARALASLLAMVEQGGADLETRDDIAARGIIVRHLVLPARRENSFAVLALIRRHCPPSLPLSIMSQYTPIPALRGDEHLNRRVTAAEYEAVVERALDLGFEQIYVQHLDEAQLVPDFSRAEPFVWNGAD